MKKNEFLFYKKKYKRAKEIYQNGLQNFLRKDVKKDDLLDALCLAVNALLGEQEGYGFVFSKKNKKDSKGLEMKMSYWKGEV